MQGQKYFNKTAGLWAEYNSLMRLRKLGYTFDGNKLSFYKARCFLIISEEIDDFEEKKAKMNRAKAGRGR